MNNFGSKRKLMPPSITSWAGPEYPEPQIRSDLNAEASKISEVQIRCIALEMATQAESGNGHGEVLIAARAYEAFLMGKKLYSNPMDKS